MISRKELFVSDMNHSFGSGERPGAIVAFARAHHQRKHEPRSAEPIAPAGGLLPDAKADALRDNSSGYLDGLERTSGPACSYSDCALTVSYER